MSQWFKFGEFTAYPFEDGVAYADNMTAVVDAAVVVRRPSRAALSRFIVSGATADIEVVDAATSAVLVSTAHAVAAVAAYGGYTIYTVNDPVTAGLVRIVVTGLAPVVTFNGLLPFAAVVHDFADVASINGLRGNVVMVLPQEISASLDSDGRVVLDAVDPADRAPLGTGCLPILTINGVSPGEGGSFSLVTGPDNNHRLRVVDGNIQISNFGVPCCTCNDYYGVYNTIAAYDKELSALLRNNISALINTYQSLVQRWHNVSMNTPVMNVSAMSSTPLVAAGAWGQPASRAVCGIMRMTPGAYSADVSMMIANATWYPALVAVVVTSNIVVATTSGSVRASPTTGGIRDFPGFPGSLSITLQPGDAVEIFSTSHDVSMAGIDAAYSAVVSITPINPGTPPPLNAVLPGPGEFSMAVHGIIPQSLNLGVDP